MSNETLFREIFLPSSGKVNNVEIMKKYTDPYKKIIAELVDLGEKFCNFTN